MTTESTCCLRREEIGPCAASSATLRNSSPPRECPSSFPRCRREPDSPSSSPRARALHGVELRTASPLRNLRLAVGVTVPSLARRAHGGRPAAVIPGRRAGRGTASRPRRPSAPGAWAVSVIATRPPSSGPSISPPPARPCRESRLLGGCASSPFRRRRAQARRVPELLGLRQRRNSELAALFPPSSPSFSLSDPALCLRRRAFKRANARDGDTLVASAWAPPCCPELPAPPDARGIQPRRFRTEASAKFSALFILSSCEQVRIMMDCEQIALPCFFRP